ncbi:hypothetical protein [Candidatus Harpocratesius sp.]
MGKSTIEKLDYAKSLLRAGIPYRDIQIQLRIKFGSGVSNTTLQNLYQEMIDEMDLRSQLSECKRELALYKKLYFELVDAMKEKLK